MPRQAETSDGSSSWNKTLAADGWQAPQGRAPLSRHVAAQLPPCPSPSAPFSHTALAKLRCQAGLVDGCNQAPIDTLSDYGVPILRATRAGDDHSTRASRGAARPRANRLRPTSQRAILNFPLVPSLAGPPGHARESPVQPRPATSSPPCSGFAVHWARSSRG